MQSPEARQYDELQTPDSGEKSRRNFGVRRRKYGATDQVVENARDGTETAAFQHARRHSVIGRHAAVEDFDFSDDAGARRNRANHNHNGSSTHGNGGNGKYIQNPRANPIAIRPGASIMGQTSTSERPPPANEEEERLRHQYGSPPRKLDSFLQNIVRKAPVSTTRSASGLSRVQPPRTNGSRSSASLESVSAPSSTVAMKKPLVVIPSRQGWQAPTRIPRDTSSPTGSKRARIELTPNTSRRISSGTKDPVTTNGGATRMSARISNRPTRNPFGIYDDDSASSSVVNRYSRRHSSGSSSQQGSDGGVALPLRRSTRSSQKPKDGTEDMPIHLSDSDENDDTPISRTDASEPQSQAVDDGSFDMNDVRKESVIDFQSVRAWFGERTCHIDVYVGRDALWLCSVRGVESKWPFEQNYRIQFKRVKRILTYRWTSDQVGTVDTNDPAGKVMSTTSFIALQFPIPNLLRKCEWREFYDPDAEVSSSKRYLVLLPNDEDRGAEFLSALEDMISDPSGGNSGLLVEHLNTLEDIRPIATQMTEHDHHYVFQDRTRTEEPRRSRRQRDVEGDGLDTVQLTYPLPPCTVDVVTITRQDIARLQPAEYLNDNIIDYYFKRLLVVDYSSNERIKQNVLFLSSHFYSRLRAGKGVTMKERLAAGYKNVSTWLTRSELFSKTLVFVPINKDLHWSLAVIINPQCAGGIDKSDDDNAPQTCIALLDPLGGYHSSIPILRNLKSFLEFEWERVFGDNGFVPSRVSKIQVSAPLQTNSFDCGVFVLKYAQEMLANFAKVLADPAIAKTGNQVGFMLPRTVTDDGLTELIPHDAFTSRDVTNKRKELQSMLEEDTKSYEALLDTR